MWASLSSVSLVRKSSNSFWVVALNKRSHSPRLCDFKEVSGEPKLKKKRNLKAETASLKQVVLQDHVLPSKQRSKVRRPLSRDVDFKARLIFTLRHLQKHTWGNLTSLKSRSSWLTDIWVVQYLHDTDFSKELKWKGEKIIVPYNKILLILSVLLSSSTTTGTFVTITSTTESPRQYSQYRLELERIVMSIS